MTARGSEDQHVSGGPPQLGLERFYSDENLRRYRILARAPTSAGERRRIIMALAAEAGAFKAEMRSRPARGGQAAGPSPRPS
jgi:hypothetical protein